MIKTRDSKALNLKNGTDRLTIFLFDLDRRLVNYRMIERFLGKPRV